jgi:hypothetical protein
MVWYAGKDEAEQLRKIMQLLGAPTERIWPGVHSLPHVASGNSHNPKIHTSHAMLLLLPRSLR